MESMLTFSVCMLRLLKIFGRTLISIMNSSLRPTEGVSQLASHLKDQCDLCCSTCV